MIEGVGRGRKDFYIQNIDGLGVGVDKRNKNFLLFLTVQSEKKMLVDK